MGPAGDDLHARPPLRCRLDLGRREREAGSCDLGGPRVGAQGASSKMYSGMPERQRRSVAGCAQVASLVMHDLVITGGVVHDGLGSPGAPADVAIEAGRVVAVGKDVGPARRTIAAEGRFVTPGFVDAHSHSDALPLMTEPQPFKLLQGVTTEVVGNCGFSVAPLDDVSARYVDEAWGDLLPGVSALPGLVRRLPGPRRGRRPDEQHRAAGRPRDAPPHRERHAPRALGRCARHDVRAGGGGVPRGRGRASPPG